MLGVAHFFYLICDGGMNVRHFVYDVKCQITDIFVAHFAS